MINKFQRNWRKALPRQDIEWIEDYWKNKGGHLMEPSNTWLYPPKAFESVNPDHHFRHKFFLWFPVHKWKYLFKCEDEKCKGLLVVFRVSL